VFCWKGTYDFCYATLYWIPCLLIVVMSLAILENILMHYWPPILHIQDFANCDFKWKMSTINSLMHFL
jgi:hypothetical protein